MGFPGLYQGAIRKNPDLSLYFEIPITLGEEVFRFFRGVIILGNNFIRILIAGFLSLIVYSGTWYWYQAHRIFVKTHDAEKPIAYIAESIEDVKRRPAERLIWQEVATGEPVYPGEALATSANSSAKIRFIQGHRTINLDSDSLIVLNQSKEELTLDLMEGSLLVDSAESESKSESEGPETSAPALMLKSKTGKVDVTNATAVISNNKGKTDFQLIKGKVKDAGGKEVKSQESQAIRVVSPALDRPTIVNPDEVEPVQFSWEGAPKNSRVQLWLGSSRKNLKNIAELLNGEHAVAKRLPQGKHFFKIVALDSVTKQQQAESSIYRFELIARFPPVAVAPEKDARVIVSGDKRKVRFRWSAPEEASSTSLEIARDVNFKDKVNTQFFTNQESIQLDLSQGDYFYRLSSNYSGVKKVFTTAPIHFSVAEKVLDPIKILWTNEPTEKKYYYLDKPTVPLSWTVAPADKVRVKKWVVHLWPVSAGRSPAENSENVLMTEKAEATAHLATRGLYYAKVEAQDTYEQVIGQSEIRELSVSPRPLIAAPQLIPEKGDFSSDNKGNIALQWTQQPEAKEYHLQLLDKNGKIFYSGISQKNTSNLEGLLPGKYQVNIFAIDIYGRESEKGQPRVLLVPEKSGLKAPRVGKVQVE